MNAAARGPAAVLPRPGRGAARHGPLAARAAAVTMGLGITHPAA